MLSGKDFAIQNAGSNVLITYDMFIEKQYFVPNEQYIARVIGHYGGSWVALELANKDANHGMYLRRNPLVLSSTEYVVEKPYECGVYITPNNLELCNYKYKHLQKAYPNTCKKCGSPARINSSIVLCSNILCKATTHLQSRISKIGTSKNIC